MLDQILTTTPRWVWTLLIALLHETGVGLGFSALYGFFSGVFLARAARLWRLALASEEAGTARTACAIQA